MRFIYAISGPVNDIISNTCVCVYGVYPAKKRIDKIKQKKKHILRLSLFFLASINTHITCQCWLHNEHSETKNTKPVFSDINLRAYIENRWSSNSTIPTFGRTVLIFARYRLAKLFHSRATIFRSISILLNVLTENLEAILPLQFR